MFKNVITHILMTNESFRILCQQHIMPIQAPTTPPQTTKKQSTSSEILVSRRSKLSKNVELESSYTAMVVCTIIRKQHIWLPLWSIVSSCQVFIDRENN